MVKELLDIIKANSNQILDETSEISENQKEDIQTELVHGVQEGFSNALSLGNLSDFKDILSSGKNAKSIANNAIVRGIINKLTSSISEKFNLPPKITKSIVDAVIPKIVNHVTSLVAKKGSEEVDLGAAVQLLTGKESESFDLQGLLGSFLSKDKGTEDLGDLASKLLNKKKEDKGGLLDSFF